MLMAVAVLLGASLPITASAQAMFFTGQSFGKGVLAGVGPSTTTLTLDGTTMGNNQIATTATPDRIVVPANILSEANVLTICDGIGTCTFAPYRKFIINSNDNVGAGTLSAGYASPFIPMASQMATVNSQGVNDAYVTGQPRDGMMRINPGANGFGGRIPLNLNRLYEISIYAPVGTFVVNGPLTNTIGGTSFGVAQNNVLPGTSTNAALNLTQNVTPVTTKGFWFTGNISVTDMVGSANTTVTMSGADNRNAAAEGTISLVTPRLQWVYERFPEPNPPPGFATLREGFSMGHRLDLTFVPEPGMAAGLMAGLVGMIGMARSRRTN